MFIKKIKINTPEGILRQIRFFGINMYQYWKDKNGKKDCNIPLLFERKSNYEKNENPVFYLKVNKLDGLTLLCLSHWINIAHFMQSDFYIVCDNNKLEEKLLKKINFHDPNIKFIKSERKPFYKFVKAIKIPKNWYNTTFSHLTTFSHAKRHGFKSFWNIDADDTIFLCECPKIAGYLKNISNYADNENIDAFSLDMHHSFLNGKHWSFGITYTRNCFNWIDKLLELSNNNWMHKDAESMKNIPGYPNFDWFMTWCGKMNYLNIKSWYIENLYFLHHASPFIYPDGTLVCFKNGNIDSPIFSKIYGCNELRLGYLPIAKDDIKFDFGVSEKDCINFVLDNLIQRKQFNITTDFLFDRSSN